MVANISQADSPNMTSKIQVIRRQNYNKLTQQVRHRLSGKNDKHETTPKVILIPLKPTKSSANNKKVNN